MANNVVFLINQPAQFVLFLRIIQDSKLDLNPVVIIQEQVSVSEKIDVILNYLTSKKIKYLHVNRESVIYYGRNIIKHIFNSIQLKKIIIERADAGSLFVTFDPESLSSVLCQKVFPQSVAVVTKNKTPAPNDCSYAILLSMTANVINFILGLSSIKIFRVKNSDVPVFHKVHSSQINKVYLNSSGHEQNNVIKLSSVEVREGDKILLIGSAYLSWRISSETRSAIMRIYRAIFEKYKRDAQFDYIPHPLENGEELEEINEIFNGSVRIVNNYISSEHYLIENKNVFLCVSIGSNASINAYNLGFNSKVFYRSVLLSDSTVSIYDEMFRDMPENMHINGIGDIGRIVQKKNHTDPDMTAFDKLLQL